eukprot:scaffold10277_cov100-Skeletonema_dohrnii-CCMP3373.AAC.1
MSCSILLLALLWLLGFRLEFVSKIGEGFPHNSLLIPLLMPPAAVNIFTIVATTMMSRGVNAIATLLAILLIAITTSAFSVPPMATSYPRELHPGGFSLPPMVEDLIPIATTITSAAADNDSQSEDEILQKDLLLVRPPDMESLWEWYAYTKRQTDSDPSWGRIWPTALSLARFTLQSLHSGEVEDDSIDMNLASNLNEQD